MKNFLYSSSRYAFVFLALCLQKTAFAAPEGVQALTTPTPEVGTLFEFVTEVLSIVIKIGIPVVSLALIFSGYMFLTAQGDEKKLTDAKKGIVWTTVGGAILLCAVVIATIINNTIGQLGG